MVDIPSVAWIVTRAPLSSPKVKTPSPMTKAANSKFELGLVCHHEIVIPEKGQHDGQSAFSSTVRERLKIEIERECVC